jgi:general secretion pathway protein F
VTSPAHFPSAVTQEELIAFCDEVAALARAGVPLERGLVALAGDLPGRLGAMTGDVAERLERGEPLDQVLESSAGSVSPVVRAVLLAGVRSGRLSVALENMAHTLRRTQQLKRLSSSALVYPLILVATAYVLFLLLAVLFSEVVGPSYQHFQLTENGPLAWMIAAGESARWWAIWPPIGLGLLLGGWWLRSRQAAWPREGGRLSRWATPGRLLQLGRLAGFADTLSLLVRAGVPLHEALPLAGDASGDHRLAADARDLAERIQRGESPDVFLRVESAIPKRLAWRIAAGAARGDLAALLQDAADRLRQEAEQTYTVLTASIPLLLTLSIGGAATLVYAVVALTPWFMALSRLAERI